MVGKQLFFDSELAIEDKPQGKEGGKAQPGAGDEEQAQSPKQETCIHGMPDIVIRAMGNENGTALDGREDIKVTQAHDLDGPAGEQEGGDEQQQGRKIDITPMRGRRQQEKEDELTGDKQPPVLFFHSHSFSCRHVFHFFPVPAHCLDVEGFFYWSLHLVGLRLVDKVGHSVLFLLSGNDFLGLFLADLE